MEIVALVGNLEESLCVMSVNDEGGGYENTGMGGPPCDGRTIGGCSYAESKRFCES